MIVEWDDEKAASNKRKHGVEFTEAVTVLEDPLSFTVRDPRQAVDEVRFLTIGQSSTGRILVVAHTDRGDAVRLNRPGQPRDVSDARMKKGSRAVDEDMLPEYDFKALGPGVRGKYVERMKGLVTFVGLEADVAKAFPTGEAVNEALRAVLKVSAVVRRRATVSKRRTRRRPHSSKKS